MALRRSDRSVRDWGVMECDGGTDVMAEGCTHRPVSVRETEREREKGEQGERERGRVAPTWEARMEA